MVAGILEDRQSPRRSRRSHRPPVRGVPGAQSDEQPHEAGVGVHGREPGRSTAPDRLVEDGLGLVEATDLQKRLAVVG